MLKHIISALLLSASIQSFAQSTTDLSPCTSPGKGSVEVPLTGSVQCSSNAISNPAVLAFTTEFINENDRGIQFTIANTGNKTTMVSLYDPSCYKRSFDIYVKPGKTKIFKYAFKLSSSACYDNPNSEVSVIQKHSNINLSIKYYYPAS